MGKTTTATATGAPIPVTLNGKIWKVSPLRDRDYGEFEAWVQDEVIETVKRNLEGLSEEARQRQLDRVFDLAHEITISSPQSIAKMSTITGAAKLLFLGLRHEHPSVTEEEVLSMVTDPANLANSMDAIQRVNALSGKKGATRKVKVKRKSVKHSSTRR